jgi:hypothetical protein
MRKIMKIIMFHQLQKKYLRVKSKIKLIKYNLSTFSLIKTQKKQLQQHK